jgi:lipoprotein LprG
MSPTRRSLIAVVTAVLLAACSGGDDGDGGLPDGTTLLADSADAMAAVESVEFRMEVEGPTGSTGLRGVSGVLTNDGEGQGTVSLEQFGVLVEFEVVVADGTFYLKGPTGGYQVLPDALADQIYDPTALLDEDEGISDLLRTATGAATVGQAEVGGTDAYEVTARIDRSLIESLLPLPEGQEMVPATLWIAAEDDLLLKVLVESGSGEERSVLTLFIDDFDVDATITPPAT